MRIAQDADRANTSALIVLTITADPDQTASSVAVLSQNSSACMELCLSEEFYLFDKFIFAVNVNESHTA